MTPTTRLIPTIFLLAVVLFSSPPIAAQTDPFYTGKTVRIIVGATPGGFYDRWARLLARYIPKSITGNPNCQMNVERTAGEELQAQIIINLPRKVVDPVKKVLAE